MLAWSLLVSVSFASPPLYLGIGDSGLATIDSDGDGVPLPFDCDDSNPERYPGAPERVADGLDSDCDLQELCYVDGDGDQVGSSDTELSSNLSCAGDGVAAEDGDCDDGDSGVFPGAAEVVADGEDQDCDGVDLCYVDGDGDGYGADNGVVFTGSTLDCSAGGESNEPTDCDDGDAGIHPDAPELPGDEVDSNCTGIELCFSDGDGDGYGSSGTVTSTDIDCADAGESTNDQDCDDGDGNVNPDASEGVADGVDADCDGLELCYDDDDFDDAGDPTQTVTSSSLTCSASGVADNPDDCDDGDGTVYEGAPEIPDDGIDQDCDGADLVGCFEDLDGDGFGSSVTVYGGGSCGAGTSTVAGDCHDGDNGIFPGADEHVADGTDSDCDGLELCYLDGDDDGFGSSSLVASSDLDCDGGGAAGVDGDCDDGDDDVNPAQVEQTCNGVDDDCDGGTPDSVDGDGDGSDSCADCNDTDGTVFPGADEVVADGVDQDCDGLDACYVDGDLDGVGAGAWVPGAYGCSDPGLSDRDDDCDDGDDDVSPLASEVPCDGVDQDCDGLGDDDPDDDGDTYTLCVDDCDDTNADVNPGRYEVACNLLDDDCDPSTEDGDDADKDGAALCAGDCDDNNPSISPLLTEELCTGIDEDCSALTPDAPDQDGDGISVCDDDCDDTDPYVNPGVVEIVCNGINDDCDTRTPDGCIDSGGTADTATRPAPTGDSSRPLPTAVTGDTGEPAGSTPRPTGDTAVAPGTPIDTAPPPGRKAPTPSPPSYGFGCQQAPPTGGWLLAVVLWFRRRS